MKELLTSKIRNSLSNLVMEIDTPEARHFARCLHMSERIDYYADCNFASLTEHQRHFTLVYFAYDDLLTDIRNELGIDAYKNEIRDSSLENFIQELLRLVNSPEAAYVVSEVIERADDDGLLRDFDQATPALYLNLVGKTEDMLRCINRALNEIVEKFAERKAKKEVV